MLAMICMEINYCARQQYSRPLPLIIDQFAGVCCRGGRLCLLLFAVTGRQCQLSASHHSITTAWQGREAAGGATGKGKPDLKLKQKIKKKKRNTMILHLFFFFSLRAKRRCYVRVPQCLSKGKLMPSLLLNLSI